MLSPDLRWQPVPTKQANRFGRFRLGRQERLRRNLRKRWRSVINGSFPNGGRNRKKQATDWKRIALPPCTGLQPPSSAVTVVYWATMHCSKNWRSYWYVTISAARLSVRRYSRSFRKPLRMRDTGFYRGRRSPSL